jgi:hypothetical protein
MFFKCGDIVGRWKLTKSTRKGPVAAWHCRCECGSTGIVREHSLRAGASKSCGCLQKEIARERIRQRSGSRALNYRHGESPAGGMTPEYKAFHHAKARCQNPNTPFYYRYGARGIEFRFADFAQFLGVVGRRPADDYSLDRINNDGHYEPGNVRWADAHTQAMNRGPRGR